MATFYEEMAGVAAEMLAEFKQGVVTLSRSTPGAVNSDEPWVIPAASTVVYELDATVRGVSSKYVDGTVVLASDEMALCSPVARQGADGLAVAIEPAMTDVVTVDGKVRTLRKIERIPAAGTAAAFILFIGP